MSWELVLKESKFYTKRKLRKLLEILEKTDMDDTSKVGYAKGFVKGMIEQID